MCCRTAQAYLQQAAASYEFWNEMVLVFTNMHRRHVEGGKTTFRKVGSSSCIYVV